MTDNPLRLAKQYQELAAFASKRAFYYQSQLLKGNPVTSRLRQYIQQARKIKNDRKIRPDN